MATFEPGDIVVWHGSLAIVVEHSLQHGVTVKWLLPHPEITQRFAELQAFYPDWLDSGWDADIFEKVGHVDDI